MKGFTAFLIGSVVLLCLVQACAAVSSSNIAITPPQVNALKPGDVISEVTGTIYLPASGDQTFALDDSLDFFTQLDRANWSISIVINDIPNPPRAFSGKHASLLGMDLAYVSSKYDVKVQFSMNDGVVPPSFTSGSIILTRVQETNTRGDQVGNVVYVNGTVINTQALGVTLNNIVSDLADLKKDIDARQSAGVDVAVALQNYTAAKTAITQAQAALISSPQQVQSLMDTATAKISAAAIDLNRAVASQAIQRAKTTLTSVDGLITEFTVNDSLKTSDPRLVAIINKRDLAAQAISNANDFLTTGNYASAQTKGNEGTTLANQALNLSTDLKTELGKGFSLPGLPNLGPLLPILAVAVVVLIVVGVIIYRRKMRWDELG
jgi:hypothetical protein